MYTVQCTVYIGRYVPIVKKYSFIDKLNQNTYTRTHSHSQTYTHTNTHIHTHTLVYIYTLAHSLPSTCLRSHTPRISLDPRSLGHLLTSLALMTTCDFI